MVIKMETINNELKNFCPSCMKKSKSILYCTNCASGMALIEEPIISVDFETPEFDINKTKEYIGEALGTQETDVGTPLMPEKLAGSALLDEEEIQEIIGAIPLQAFPQQSPALVQAVAEQVAELEPENAEYKHSKFHFLTGEGGSGKTFLVRKRAAENPRYIELCSTTGIAAVNLGGRTVHSTLKFFNEKSLRKNWESGQLQTQLRKVRQNKDNLGIEECSMLSKGMFDLILAGIDEINNDRSGKQLGLHLIGDFAQLPPVPEEKGLKAEFCFQSDQWSRFSVEKLTKIWRQDNPDFIQAIRYARYGDGNSCVAALLDAGVRFEDKIDNWFNGTTLIPKNDEVDFYNTKRLNQLNSPMLRTVRKYEGTPLKEWDKMIPMELRLKKEACVMILSNDIPDFNYVNGDIGWIKDYDEKTDRFKIELKRTGSIVSIARTKRLNLTEYAPNPEYFKAGFSPYVDRLTGDWVIGTVSYHPIKLAYASTIHKSQGLSLDLVQIDTNAWFFSHPGMAYVSLSRCRTPEGLVIVGKPQDVAAKIKSAPEVRKWI